MICRLPAIKAVRLVLFVLALLFSALILKDNLLHAKQIEEMAVLSDICDLEASPLAWGGQGINESDSLAKHHYSQNKVFTDPEIIASMYNLLVFGLRELPHYSVQFHTDKLNNLIVSSIPDGVELPVNYEDFGKSVSPSYIYEGYEEDLDFTIDIAPVVKIKPKKADSGSIIDIAAVKALEMLEQRYRDEIKQKGGTLAVDEQEFINFTQNSVHKLAEKAFRSFIEQQFQQYDFGELGYSTIRAHFMNTYMNVVNRTVTTFTKNAAQKMISSGDFKTMKFDSEILKNVRHDIVHATVETGLAIAKNSKYAFLRNLEITYKLREHGKPEYSVSTLQPLYSSKGRRHNVFGQASVAFEDDRQDMNAGFGYRYLPDHQDYVVGGNLFFDFQKPYNHMRASFGLDVQTSLWGASTNFYKGLNDWKNARFGFEEKPLDGIDLEVVGRMPFLPALEVSGRGYQWFGEVGADDIEGYDIRLAYSPVPAFTIEGEFNDEKDRDSAFEFALRYNYVFGAPMNYLYDWDEQFRQKSAAEYIFRRARRENQVRVQERLDPDLLAAGIISPALLLSSPLAGAGAVSVGSDLVLTFDRDVLAGAGNIVFTDTTDASDDFTIPVGDPRVNIVNNVVTIDLSAQLLEFNSGYEVTMAPGVLTDTSANNFTGLGTGDLAFNTIVDPTATFGPADNTIAPGGTGASVIVTTTLASFQTTINVGAGPDGVIFECGGTGRGIAAWFDSGNLVFAAGDGTATTTTADTLFGSFPIASIPQGLHHFTFVAEPSAPAEIGVYMDGVRVISANLVGAMDTNQWSGGNDCGYGLDGGGSIRAGGNTNNITNAILTNNLSFYTNDQPLDF